MARVEEPDGAVRRSAVDESVDPAEPLTKQDFEALARFRFGIRRYLRFSEETVRGHGITPQQYQLMLALKGFPGRDWAVVRELADRLQLRHHSVVELVNRAQTQGLVHRTADPDDARAVRVVLTDQGEELLGRLSALHRDELRRMDDALALPRWHAGAPASGTHLPDRGAGASAAADRRGTLNP
jgi:DNA-binding MarR family transcriptional regulator